jgi:drug/metabolite transporter (DMT)-like permease
MGGVIWVIRERHGDPSSAEGPTGKGPQAVKRLRQGIAFGVIAALCQALGNVLTKLGGAEISALEISIVRLAAGILGLTIILGVTKNLVATIIPMRDRRLAAMIIVATFLGTFLGVWLMNAGLRYTHTSIASTLSSTSPIFVLPLAYFIEKEKLSWRSILGAFIAVIGVAILFFF